MTMPGGAGGQTGASREETQVPEDSDPGLPAATGPLAGEGPGTGDPSTAGSATESTGEGTASDAETATGG